MSSVESVDENKHTVSILSYRKYKPKLSRVLSEALQQAIEDLDEAISDNNAAYNGVGVSFKNGKLYYNFHELPFLYRNYEINILVVSDTLQEVVSYSHDNHSATRVTLDFLSCGRIKAGLNKWYRDVIQDHRPKIYELFESLPDLTTKSVTTEVAKEKRRFILSEVLPIIITVETLLKSFK